MPDPLPTPTIPDALGASPAARAESSLSAALRFLGWALLYLAFPRRTG